jgi:hypothetical protein
LQVLKHQIQKLSFHPTLEPLRSRWIANLKFIWDSKNNKKEYLFQIQLPITRSAGGIEYAPNSVLKSVFGCQVVPKQEIQLNQTFIMLISILSFHIREILTFQDLSDCDQFLKNFDSSWEQKF